MTEEYEFLTQIFRTLLIVAAFCTTTVPLVFAFSEWYRTALGRVFMLQAVAFAGAIDVVTFFRFVRPEDPETIIWIYVIMFTFIAYATASVTWQIVKINYKEGSRS